MLQLEGISVSIGPVAILRNVSLGVGAGEFAGQPLGHQRPWALAGPAELDHVQPVVVRLDPFHVAEEVFEVVGQRGARGTSAEERRRHPGQHPQQSR